ncbi:DUF6670 family protein [Rhodococcus sp. NPDC003382]
MSGPSEAVARAVALVSRSGQHVGAPEGGPLPVVGRGRWAHHGVMIGDLPAPHRFLSVMGIAGRPGPVVFDQPAAPDRGGDSVTLVSTTAATTESGFTPLSIRRDCDLRPGTASFGEHLSMTVSASDVRVQRTWPADAVAVDLLLHPTGVITTFFAIPGLYRHSSRLCRYEGTLTDPDGTRTVTGLAALEYAHGVAVPARLPVRTFVYQVLSVDDDTQLLLTSVLGPGDVPVLRTAFLRSATGTVETVRVGVRLRIDTAREVRTPDGRRMLLPGEFRWDIPGVGHVDGHADGDWAYGLGAGYVGGIRFDGRWRGRRVAGSGYCEYIDRRSESTRPTSPDG